MRDCVPWMGGLDERILERLADEGDADAWEIAFDIFGRVSQDRVTERCKVLADGELVECYDREIAGGRVETYWSITTWGELFLNADADPSLDVPEPSPRPPHATRPDWWAGF